jgi:hypothetical protein
MKIKLPTPKEVKDLHGNIFSGYKIYGAGIIKAIYKKDIRNKNKRIKNYE